MKSSLIKLLLLGTLLSACATISVNTDYDPQADFSGLKTYNWAPTSLQKTGDARIDDNTLLASRIKTAVDNELALLGYQKTEGTPDFLINYHASIQDKMDVQTINRYAGYQGGWGWNSRDYHGRVGPGYSETYTFYYSEGTLILDIVDPETNDLLWRGSATGTVAEDATPEKRKAKIQEAVHKVFQKFPPE